jgi:hypothetical protein
MPLQSLSLKTLGELNNGLAEGIVNSAINRMVEDLDDRGDQDEQPRAVTIELIGRVKDGITTVEVRATCKLPKYNAGRTVAEIKMSNEFGKRRPVMQFRGDSPAQQTLDDAYEGESK